MPKSDYSLQHSLIAYRTGSFTLPVIAAPTQREWMSNTDRHFAYRCLPLQIANQSGWLILNNFAITATWSGLDNIDAVNIEYRKGYSPPLVRSHFGYGILTWNLPFLFRTPKEFNLLVRGPANYPKDGVYPLEGVVETDWSSATFTMNWRLTRPNLPVRFEVDEPICMIVPQRRGELEQFQPEIRSIESDVELKRRHDEWCASREQYIKDLNIGSLQEQDPGWQRHYFHGKHVTSEQDVSTHQTKLYLRPFEEK